MSAADRREQPAKSLGDLLTELQEQTKYLAGGPAKGTEGPREVASGPPPDSLLGSDRRFSKGFLDEVYRAVLQELEQTEAADDPANALARGDRFGRFHIERTLGVGGMGSVHVAFDPSLGRRVALKQIRPELVGSAEIRRRFELEVRAISSVSHPNLCTIHEVGVHDGIPFLVMPLIEGVSLASVLDDAKATTEAKPRDTAARRSMAWFTRLIEEVARAIDAAHRAGIIHRDLKPANVMIRSDDSPVVVDFGLAHFTDGSGMTRSGTTAGTRDYMAPEQVAPAGRRPDARTDVWALGVMLYECVTRQRPFGGRDDREVDNAILRGNPRRPRQMVAGVSKDLETVILTSLSVERDWRYPNALALAEDLRRLREREPIRARRASLARRAMQWCRREPMAATTLLVVIVSLIVTTVLLTNANRQNQRFRLLQLADRVTRAESAAERLFPIGAETLDDIRGWLEDFGEPIRASAPQAASAMDEVRRLADTLGPSSPEAFLREALTSRLATLEDMTSRGGLIERIERRRQRSESIRSASIERHADAWAASLHRANGALSEPLVGLIPLGADPDSGLEEFLDLHTSSDWTQIPARDRVSGALDIRDDCGVILVLVPGRRAIVGAQSGSPDGLNYDAVAGPEVGVKELEFPRLLVSKYEFTQSQWASLEARDTSYYPAGTQMLGRDISIRHPAENMTAQVARRVLARAHMRLPSADEWEYLARAGSPWPWYCGDRAESLQGHANVLDRFAVLHEPQWWTINGHPREGSPPTEDGFNIHAPVGRFRPNAFGLHDVIGNVAELVDLPALGPDSCALRGGTFSWDGEQSRAWQSRTYQSTVSDGAIGIRPVRSL